ncbi:3'-5' exoribonuclease [Salmonella enterica]|nr:3'-5' exoribonuclease [Salmonella enterica]
MNNVMIDIETLGTGHHAAIASVAAAIFDSLTGEIAAEEYIRVDWKEDCEIYGGEIDPATVEWWLKKSSAVRAELIAGDKQLALEDALNSIFSFIERHSDVGPVYVWSKSPSFDLSLIKDAAGRTSIPFSVIPWKYWNERDVRTIEGIGAQLNISLPYSSKEATHHALADVRGQIRNVVAVMSALWAGYEATEA